jgi:hypothetical protein
MLAQSLVIEVTGGGEGVASCSSLEVVTPSIPPSMWGNIEWFKDGISTGQFGIAFNTLLPGQHYAVYTSGGSSITSNSVNIVAHTPLILTLVPDENLRYINLSATNCGNDPLFLTKTNSHSYTQVHWYRNGDLYDFGTSFTGIEIVKDGLYQVQANGPCGVESSDKQVNYADATELTTSPCNYNTRFQSGGSIASGQISNEIIGGDLYITGNPVLLVESIFMLNNARIIINPGAKLVVDQAVIYSMDGWYGFVLNGGEFEISDEVRIYDAQVGILSLNNGILDAEAASVYEMWDNITHIAADNSVIKIGNGLFKNIKNQAISHPDYTTFTPKHKNMIYLQHSSVEEIHHSVFDQRDDNVQGAPNTFSAIELVDCPSSVVGSCDFLDNLIYGVYSENCTDISVNHNHFGASYTEPINGIPFNDPGLERAISFNQSSNTTSHFNTIRSSESGIEFYYNGTQSYGSIISDCDVYGSESGIIIAPDINPLLNSDPNLNTSTTPIQLDVVCNRLHYLDYGIVGSGVKTDFLTNLNEEPSISYSNCQHWKIIWRNTSSTPIDYSYYGTDYPDPFSNTGPNVLLDAVNINTNVNHIWTTSATSSACLPGWTQYKEIPIIPENPHNVRIYPNPFNTILHIESFDTPVSFVELFNLSGQLVVSGTSPNQLLVASIPPGFYQLKISFTNEKSEFFKVVRQ